MEDKVLAADGSTVTGHLKMNDEFTAYISADWAKLTGSGNTAEVRENVYYTEALEGRRFEPVPIFGIEGCDVVEHGKYFWTHFETLCNLLGLDHVVERARIEKERSFRWRIFEYEDDPLDDPLSRQIFCIDAEQVCGWLFTVSAASVGPEFSMLLNVYRLNLQGAVNAYIGGVRSARAAASAEPTAEAKRFAAKLTELHDGLKKMAKEMLPVRDSLLKKPEPAKIRIPDIWDDDH